MNKNLQVIFNLVRHAAKGNTSSTSNDFSYTYGLAKKLFPVRGVLSKGDWLLNTYTAPTNSGVKLSPEIGRESLRNALLWRRFAQLTPSNSYRWTQKLDQNALNEPLPIYFSAPMETTDEKNDWYTYYQPKANYVGLVIPNRTGKRPSYLQRSMQRLIPAQISEGLDKKEQKAKSDLINKLLRDFFLARSPDAQNEFIEGLGHEVKHSLEERDQLNSTEGEVIPELQKYLDLSIQDDPKQQKNEVEATLAELKRRMYAHGINPYSENVLPYLIRELTERKNSYILKMSQEDAEKLAPYLLFILRGVAANDSFNKYRGHT